MIARFVLAALLAVVSQSALAAVAVDLAPGAQSAPFRKIWLAPAHVEIDPRMLADSRQLRGSLGRIRPQDAERIASDLSSHLREALGEALRARGFTVVAAPGTDAVTFAARLTHVYVNAPADPLTGRSLARSAGHARLVVEGRDGAGARLLRVVADGEAQETAGFHEVHASSARHAFASMFREWAEALAAALPTR